MIATDEKNGCDDFPIIKAVRARDLMREALVLLQEAGALRAAKSLEIALSVLDPRSPRLPS